jgi:hypothetical protein
VIARLRYPCRSRESTKRFAIELPPPRKRTASSALLAADDDADAQRHPLLRLEVSPPPSRCGDTLRVLARHASEAWRQLFSATDMDASSSSDDASSATSATEPMPPLSREPTPLGDNYPDDCVLPPPQQLGASMSLDASAAALTRLRSSGGGVATPRYFIATLNLDRWREYVVFASAQPLGASYMWSRGISDWLGADGAWPQRGDVVLVYLSRAAVPLPQSSLIAAMRLVEPAHALDAPDTDVRCQCYYPFFATQYRAAVARVEPLATLVAHARRLPSEDDSALVQRVTELLGQTFKPIPFGAFKTDDNSPRALGRASLLTASWHAVRDCERLRRVLDEFAWPAL